MKSPRRLSVTAIGALTCAALLPAALLLPGATGIARAAAVTDPAALVNPFIGTANGGDTFPGADAPFGMVAWSPDTTSRPDGGGYSYTDSAITGFSLTHMSGPGCPAEGDVPVLPTTGAVNMSATDPFSHSNESASAGAYQVKLNNGVTTALTGTSRTGMADFTFPATAQANLILKLSDSERGDSAVTFNVVSSTEVSGSVTSGDFCKADNKYTLYFDLQFSEPFTNHGTFTSTSAGTAIVHHGARHLATSATAAPHFAMRANSVGGPTYHGKLPPGRAPMQALTGPNGAWLTFNTTANHTVLAKAGVSFVSTANAAANVAAENPGWDFSATQSAAQAAWNSLLGKIAISGGTSSQQVVFYTALYHALLHPNIVSDANGQYRGVDGKVHTVDSGHTAFYSNFSGWDIYRSQAQLEGLIDPAVASDTAQSMVDDYAQDGMFPKWMENNTEAYAMVGDPADSILADYYAFGARNFDTTTALNDMVAEATKANGIRPGLNYLNEPGFIPVNGSYGCCNFYGATSTTLEYDTADFAISALAGSLGNTSEQATFVNRAQDWQNLLNSASGFIQPRNANSSWTSGFDPTSDVNGFVEGDSWQYTAMVPFDIAGLVHAMGGTSQMRAYLGTDLRSITGANGYTALGNEPSLGIPWEYDYIGEPYLTQLVIRQVQNQIWSDAPSGMAGNDDLGTMSAWYVWSALGIYPETPGTADLALGSPMFTQAVITLPSGATLTIDGNGAADNAPYVQSATWNGASWDSAYAPPGAISTGGTLSYTLGTSPDTSWASAASAAPPSYPGTTIQPPQPRVGPVQSGVSASLCIDDNASSTTDLNKIDIFPCDGSDAQQLTIAVQTDGTIGILGKCLDVYHGGTSNGTHVDLYHCDGTGSQQWRLGSDGSLVNPESRKCLDDPGSTTAKGTQLQLYTCDRTNAQDWHLPPAPPAVTGAIKSGVSSKICLDDYKDGSANGNKIDIYPCGSVPAQQWTVEPDGTLRVNGGCMDVTHSGTSNGTLIQYYTCDGTGAQQWRITAAGTLVNPESGKCLDDPDSTTLSRTQVQIYTCDNTSAQQWTAP